MVKNNDAGGGITVKEAVITSAKVAVLIGVLYLVGYFVFVAFGKHSLPIIGDFLVYGGSIPIYPNSLSEDLDIWDIQDMFRTVLILFAIFIPVALYRKIKKQ